MLLLIGIVIIIILSVSLINENKRKQKLAAATTELIEYHKANDEFLWSLLVNEIGINKAAEQYMHYATQVVTDKGVVLAELYRMAGIPEEDAISVKFGNLAQKYSVTNKRAKELEAEYNAKALDALTSRLKSMNL